MKGKGKISRIHDIDDICLIRHHSVTMNIALIKSFTDKPWRSPATYDLIEKSLSEKWQVQSLATDDQGKLYDWLDELKTEFRQNLFVFNIAEFLDEKSKKGFLPALLDEWGLPHLGSSAATVALGLDKHETKKHLLEAGIPTPRYFVARNLDAGLAEQAEKIGFPLIVKPSLEGGHIGISDNSIIWNQDSLKEAVGRISEEYSQPSLVEEYISGDAMREFSVGIIDGKKRLFTPIEIDYPAMDVRTPILSHETALKDLEKIKAVGLEPIRDEIISLAEKSFLAVAARDYSRVDIRMDDKGCYVLEINIMPGLGPHSFIPESIHEQYGISYSQLIQQLTENSMTRQGYPISSSDTSL
ncbi:MAG: hypothetical protein CVV53_03645 [Spirochaetae bacterium HGW-Spirochaetae-9]|nr:MAG: hypothetical protein CVV53_03645 [Spirochaetae bacterium HGW-Spirochaetae-9]